MVAMLLNGGPDLPMRISQMSPWVDTELEVAETVIANLEGQPMRRVVKTHTPADGFPVWDGVTVIAVYRHPLDVFFSLRKHALNMKNQPNHPMAGPVDEALQGYLKADCDFDDFDRDSLGTVARHYTQTALNQRSADTHLFHYADMNTDHRGAVRRLANLLDLGHDRALIDTVTAASAFDTMRAQADKFAPEGGKGFWKSDTAFFDSGGTNKWKGKMSDHSLAAYDRRMQELIPDSDARRWLEFGSG